MSETLRWVGFGLGILIALGTAGSMLRTLVVPRGLTSRLAVLVGRTLVRKLFLFISNRFESYETKDRILALSGPMALLATLLTWVMVFLFAFALMLWPFVGGSFLQAVREAGSSMLTLGFVSTEGAGPMVLHFVAAFTGLIVVALQIAYLPTLYGAFNRRETLVTMLQSRAGAPAWGAEILARHQLVGILDNLPTFYNEWEQWAADVAESHSNYPVLVWFRSPHPLRNWVLGLLAVMDSAAMYLALCPERAPSAARLSLRMGFTCLRDVAAAIRMPFDPDPFPDDPIELTYEEFRAGVRRLEEVDFPIERTPEEAWEHFRGWRVNYEAIAYALADQIVAPPGPWSGPRHHLPGMNIVPLRPADRKPGDHTPARPKGQGMGW